MADSYGGGAKLLVSSKEASKKLAKVLAAWLCTGFIPCWYGQALLSGSVGPLDRIPWPLHNSRSSGAVLLAACAGQIVLLAGAAFVRRAGRRKALFTAALLVSAALAMVEIQLTMP